MIADACGFVCLTADEYGHGRCIGMKQVVRFCVLTVVLVRCRLYTTTLLTLNLLI